MRGNTVPFHPDTIGTGTGEKRMIILVYVLVGFMAQMVDGTLGMAYGVSCRTFLRAIAGVPASIVSAVVHCSEIPTTLVSGIAHWKLKNVDPKMLLKLIVPGVIGGVSGAYLLSDLGDILEPFIDVYLILIGVFIFTKAFQKESKEPKDMGKWVYLLGLVGGFLDATGGGGWGPVVNSTLIASGQDVKKSVGTTNTAEFIVTVAETAAFTALLVDFTSYTTIIVGLIIGGVIAAPIAAVACKKIPVRPLLGLVGALVTGLNIYNLVSLL
jgi:uncharacterized protein